MAVVTPDGHEPGETRGLDTDDAIGAADYDRGASQIRLDWLAVAVVVYALWRVGVFWFLSDVLASFRQLGGDSVDFVNLATSIAERGEYRLGPDSPPYSLRNPGYALYLAALMHVAEDWLDLYFFLNVLCLAALTGLTFSIGRRLRDRYTGALSAFFVASYAPFHYLTFLVYREAMCIPLFALFLLLLMLQPRGGWTPAILAALISVMAMIREEFLLLFLPASGFVVWNVCRQSWRKAALHITIMAAIAGAIFAPWVWRNWRAFHQIQLTGTLGGIQLYLGNRPDFDISNIDYGLYRQLPELETHTDHEINRIYFRRGLDYILTHPVTTVRRMGSKLLLMLSSNMRGPDDFLLICIAVVVASVIVAKAPPGRRLRWAWLVAVAVYCAGKSVGLSSRGQAMPIVALALPSVQFPLLKYLGFVGLGWLLWRREVPFLIVTWALLITVNLVFVPQHRHRWVTDVLLIISAAVALRDGTRWLRARLNAADMPLQTSSS